MRKKVFFRVFCFTALAVIATVVLITLALTVAHGDTGALTGAIIRKELPFDQLIDEKDFSWVHVSFRTGKNRKQVLKL